MCASRKAILSGACEYAEARAARFCSWVCLQMQLRRSKPLLSALPPPFAGAPHAHKPPGAVALERGGRHARPHPNKGGERCARALQVAQFVLRWGGLGHLSPPPAARPRSPVDARAAQGASGDGRREARKRLGRGIVALRLDGADLPASSCAPPLCPPPLSDEPRVGRRRAQTLPQRPDKILRRLARPESLVVPTNWGTGRAEGWGTHVNDAGDCYQARGSCVLRLAAGSRLAAHSQAQSSTLFNDLSGSPRAHRPSLTPFSPPSPTPRGSFGAGSATGWAASRGRRTARRTRGSGWTTCARGSG